MKIRISGNKELGETKTLTKKKKFDKLEKRIVRVIVRLRGVNGNGKRDIEKSI